jgi:hypothetical protein
MAGLYPRYVRPAAYAYRSIRSARFLAGSTGPGLPMAANRFAAQGGRLVLRRHPERGMAALDSLPAVRRFHDDKIPMNFKGSDEPAGLPQHELAA